jgi:hypothetical protein
LLDERLDLIEAFFDLGDAELDLAEIIHIHVNDRLPRGVTPFFCRSLK